jgi:hypothetical protein
MATVRHVTAWAGLRKFLADGFLSVWVYNQMQGDGFTVPQAYETGPDLSTYTSQHITGWFLLQSEPRCGHLVTFYYQHSASGLRATVKFLLTDAVFLIPTQELQVLKDMIKNTLCSRNNLK